MDKFKCEFCPCTFASKKDLKTHMDTFGYNREEHIRKWRKAHYDLEQPEY